MSDIFKNVEFWHKLFHEAQRGREHTWSGGKPLDWKKKWICLSNGDCWDIEWYNTSNKSIVRFKNPRRFVIELRVSSAFLTSDKFYNPVEYKGVWSTKILGNDITLHRGWTEEKFEDYMFNMVLLQQ